MDVPEELERLLEELAKAKGTTKSEVIRRAVLSYALLGKNMHSGQKVSITDEQDRVLKDVLLP